MTTFSYTTGNPSNLTAGATASMNDIQGPFTDLRTFVNGSIDGDNISSTAGQQLGLSSSAVVRRGSSIIATSESRTNVAYGTLATPDQVSSVVLPTNGVIAIWYHALWQESVAGAARAAIFIGANQLQVPTDTASRTQAAATSAGVTATDHVLSTSAMGLVSNNSNTTFGGDATTGQVIGQFINTGNNLQYEINGSVTGTSGNTFAGGAVYVWAAAGTYTISVQYKSSSGSVTVKNRKLWVSTFA